MERAITTDASLVAAQDSDNIIRTHTMAMPNVDIPQGIDIGGSPRRQETIGVLLLRLGLREFLKSPMNHLSQKVTHLEVLDLEKEKDAQAMEILKLKQRVKKLERKRKSSISHPIRRIYRQVESSNDDLDEEDASKQGRTSDKTKPKFSYFDDLDDLVDEGMAFVQKNDAENQGVSTAAKAKGVAIKDVKDSSRPIKSITTLQHLPTIDPKDKGKGVLVEKEPEKPEKVKIRDQGLAQIESDAELAQRLHEEELAELDRAQKERQKQEEATSAALAEEFDEIQARIDADHELAVRLTHEEQEKYTIEERARLLAEFFERRKKQLAAERAEAIRNKPPIRTQVRNRMITYLKHMESTKKRPRADSEEESSKKQKLEADNDLEKEELRDSMDVVPRDDVAIDVESLATKYPIVEWKTHFLNENMMYYQIIRAYGSSKNYKIFSEMLNDFNRQDVIDLDRLVNERYETTSPEGYDLLLWGDLKTLFQPNEKDEIWKNQQDYNLISWRLFDSCGVHVLLMNTGVTIHMMIENKYPLTQEMLLRMQNRRLEVDYESEMAFELLRFTRSQLQK
ncbi:hypothetical protein Tco_0138935 [Tanacetum coccineum]